MNTSPATQVAMLCQGEEVYGIGTIQKIYAQACPGLRFICMSEGALTEWLRGRGMRVDVLDGLVHFSASGSLQTLLRIPSVMLRARSDARRLDQLLRGSSIRILHTFWPPQQLIAGWMRSRGYRVVWQINNNMSRTRLGGMGMKLNHRLARWGCDLLLPASDYIAANWLECGVPTKTIRNAALPVHDAPSPSPPLPVRCLVAGRLEHSKGHHLALEAVQRILKMGHSIELDIVGGPLEDNSYADGLKSRIQEAGLDNAVRLLGFRSDLRQMHPQYHLGLQCRIDPEPCSLWVCETLVDGLPLVAAANGGTPELVRDQETGLLFESGNVDDLTQKLISLVSSPERLTSMRTAAFERGQKQFLPQRFVDETLAAYASLL